MRYQIIAQQGDSCAVTTGCRALGVSVSGYYAWRQRQATGQRSTREQQDYQLLEQIRRIYTASRGIYGSPRIHAALQQQGIRCSRKRVARLMRMAGLRSLRAVRCAVGTTDSQHQRPVAPNILARDFTAKTPNEKWVGDILGIWTAEGWLYLAALLDTYSRKIVGWALRNWRDEALVTAALQMALGRRLIGSDLIHHSDQGSQYTAAAYQTLLATHNITGQHEPQRRLL